MLIKLVLGGILLFAAIQIWTNSDGSYKTLHRIIAGILGILAFFIILPILLSYAIYVTIMFVAIFIAILILKAAL